MSVQMDRAIRRRSWRSRPILIAATGASVLLIGGYGTFALKGLSQSSVRIPADTVRIETVRSGVFRDITPFSGKVTPHDTIDLDALEGGQVEKILAQAGDTVAANQPLVIFRNTQLELDVLDREGRLVESITQLQAYEKQLEDTRLSNEKAAAQIDYEIVRLTRSAARRAQLASKGFVSREVHDQVEDELAYQKRLRPLQARSNARHEALRLKQLPQIHAQLNSLRQSLTITRAKLDNLTVRAPAQGKLTDFDLNIGKNFNRGDRLGVVVPDTGFKIEAKIDEFYLGRVREGQTANADINGKTFRFRVTRIYPQVKDGTFVVDLAFEDKPPGGLISGQSIIGKLSLGGDRQALVLPTGPFLERSGGDWMMVMEGENKALRRQVRLGRRNTEQVEILGGLKAGDRVITSDYSAFEKVDRVDMTR